ncbi:Beta-lactamase domain protein [Streptomyces venezuelae]|nr:Beta-lactamase domain protein [Streptomyces venezuelae]CUM36294.1 Metallo-beta-lactamase family protein [Streptomyces venezuelae]
MVGVVNTHFHADFVAGHLELSDETGAWIGYGRGAVTEYPIRELAEGERISLGDVTLEILETPGHTPESISVLVYERADDTVPYGVLTGDALFIGDVGRPDLLASVGVTAEEQGAMLHDSVQHKLMGLPDDVRVSGPSRSHGRRSAPSSPPRPPPASGVGRAGLPEESAPQAAPFGSPIAAWPGALERRNTVVPVRRHP